MTLLLFFLNVFKFSVPNDYYRNVTLIRNLENQRLLKVEYQDQVPVDLDIFNVVLFSRNLYIETKIFINLNNFIKTNKITAFDGLTSKEIVKIIKGDNDIEILVHDEKYLIGIENIKALIKNLLKLEKKCFVTQNLVIQFSDNKTRNFEIVTSVNANGKTVEHFSPSFCLTNDGSTVASCSLVSFDTSDITVDQIIKNLKKNTSWRDEEIRNLVEKYFLPKIPARRYRLKKDHATFIRQARTYDSNNNNIANNLSRTTGLSFKDLLSFLVAIFYMFACLMILSLIFSFLMLLILFK